MAGEVDVRAMLRRMTPQQFWGWRAYYELEPFGSARDMYHTALIAQTVANAAGARKEGNVPFDLEDFFLKFDVPPSPPKKKQTWQEQKNLLDILARASAQMEK